MAQPARKPWTLDKFLALDDGSDTRYELIGGEIVATAPPADVHSFLGGSARHRNRLEAEAAVRRGDRSRHSAAGWADTYYQAELAVTYARNWAEVRR